MEKMPYRALVLNCTLKQSPEPSHTEALIRKVTGLMEPLSVKAEILRPVDYALRFGVSSDEGKGDQWPQILEKVKAADILIIGTPIWFGVRSSVAQLVLERLDGTYNEADPETGQYPLYNKVAGVIITGNEDGAHEAAATTLFNLSHLGCMIPPNADCYWVGEAGPGPSYLDASGDKHLYTNKTARWMAHNLVFFARQLRETPIQTNLRQLTEEARAYSTDECPPSHGSTTHTRS
jgi:multimeric flavodoxin WrbA